MDWLWLASSHSTMPNNHRKNGTFRRGNTAGSKPVTKSTWIQMRVEEEKKTRYKAAATAAGKALNPWIEEVLDRELSNRQTA